MRIARTAYSLAVSALLRMSSAEVVEKVGNEILRLRWRSQEVLRQKQARRSPAIVPPVWSYDREMLSRSVLEKNPPWAKIPLHQCGIPGMLTDSEKRYYAYITKFYSGIGAAVELGPWLGLSTYYLMTGLLKNPQFAGRKMHVYDDFTWRSSWMDKWLPDADTAPENHSCFQEMFSYQVRRFSDSIVVARRKICDYDGNEALPLIEWSGDPIELIVVDCGRTLAVNDAWWNIFCGSFIKDRTIIVMEDWQNHKGVPERFWENTKLFTDSRGVQMDLVHEVSSAGIATFLYRGKDGPNGATASVDD